MLCLKHLNNLYTKVLGGSSGEYDLIDSVTSYSVLGAEFSRSVGNGTWDGCKHFFNRQKGIFPIGLGNRVMKTLDQYGIKYLVIDQRTKPKIENSVALQGIKLYPWQQDIVNISVNKSRGIIKAPTGSGKTVIASAIIAKINKPTLILTHKVDLLYQLQSRLESYFQKPIGIIGNGKIDIKDITVAMLQTLAFNFKIKQQKEKGVEADYTQLQEEDIQKITSYFDVLCVDEAHITPAKTYFNVLKQIKSPYFRYGLSATPYRTDGNDLMIEAGIGEKICNISTKMLIEQKILAEPTVYFINFKHTRASKFDSYPNIYEEHIVNNTERNNIAVVLAKKYTSQNHSVLISVTKIKHGKILSEMLTKAGITNEFAYGEISSDKRKEILDKLINKQILAVITTNVFTLGIDIPSLDILINMKAQDSPIDFIQLVGRAIRRTEHKHKCLILDIYDHNCKYLLSHSKNRLRILQDEEGFNIYGINAEQILNKTK